MQTIMKAKLKKNLGRLYICSGGANLHSQGKVMLGLNEVESTPKARYKKKLSWFNFLFKRFSGKNTFKGETEQVGLRVSILNCPKTIIDNCLS